MLQRTFQILPGIRAAREQGLWSSGTADWDAFLDSREAKGIGTARKERMDERLKEAKRRAAAGDAAYFSHALSTTLHWRMFNAFKDDALYLDIETDGYRSGLTVIGLHDGDETFTMVRGFNLDKETFLHAISKAKMLVSFNGASFDLPVLRRYFRIALQVPHIDLRRVCQQLKYSGGLKAIEKEFGIKRSKELCGIDAVTLWKRWRCAGEREALDMLVAYNEADAANLAPLARMAIPELWESVTTRMLHR